MGLRRLVTCLAATLALGAVTVPTVASAHSVQYVYTKITVAQVVQAIQTNDAALFKNAGVTAPLQDIEYIRVLPGTVNGYYVWEVVDAFSAKVASALEADAKAGASVRAWVTNTPANVKLANQMRAAHVNVTMVRTHSNAYLTVTPKGAYLLTPLGGVLVTDTQSLAVLKQLILHTGKNAAFGGKLTHGVVTSPGAARAFQKVMGQSFNRGHGPGSLIVKTGDVRSLMMEDTLANLAKLGVKITLIVPSGARLGALATTLETHGDQVVFAKSKFTGTEIVSDNTYGMVYSGNLDVYGLTDSEQIGLLFTGTVAQDLEAFLKSQA